MTGRATEDQQLRLEGDRERMCWQLLGRDRDPQTEAADALLGAVAELAQACGGSWEGSASDLLAALEYGGEMTASTLSYRLQRDAAKLRMLYGLELRVRRTRERRLLTLSPALGDAP